jgi:hypothetical protein
VRSARDRVRVESAAKADNALVGALAGDIDAHDQGCRRILDQRARHRLVDPLAVDELQRAGAREDAHADADEIGILAMILFPFRCRLSIITRADEMID